VLASAVAIGAALMFGQSTLNLRWEYGFYGDVSAMTLSLLTSSGLTLALATAEVSLAVGWYRRLEGAGVGLVALGMLLSLVYGDLLGVVLAVATYAVASELGEERAAAQR